MLNELGQSCDGDSFWVITAWIFDKGVVGVIEETFGANVVRDVGDCLAGFVGVDCARLHDDEEVVLDKHRRASRLRVIIRNANLRPNSNRVFPQQRQVRRLTHKEVTRRFIVNNEAGQIRQGHRLGVIANRVLVKDVQASLQICRPDIVNDLTDLCCRQIGTY